MILIIIKREIGNHKKRETIIPLIFIKRKNVYLQLMRILTLIIKLDIVIQQKHNIK